MQKQKFAASIEIERHGFEEIRGPIFEKIGEGTCSKSEIDA